MTKTKTDLYKQTPVGLIPSDWEIVTLGDVVTDMKSGLSRELSSEDIGLPVIRSNNLINNVVDYNDIKYWYTTDNQGANTANYFLYEGDILVNFINSISQIGKCAYYKNVLKRPVIFTTNLMVVRFNNTLIDSRFFLYYTLINHYQKFVDSITKPAINQASFTTKDYKKLIIPLPPLHEQKAIAHVLSTWDNAIQKTEQLLAQKEQRKKWLMQNLLTGKMRLPAFANAAAGKKGVSGEWEQVRLSEIAEIDKLTLGSQTASDYSFQYISLSDVDAGVVKIETKRILFKDSPSRARRIVRKGDVLLATVRPTLQAFLIIRDDVKDLIASTGFAVITCKKINNEFLYQYLFTKDLMNQIEALLTGSNYPAINSSDVKQLKFPLPPQKEQIAIAQVLQAADKEITLLKTKATKLREQKKGLMQQLLTGKKRLNQNFQD